ncbi:hypothetical protein [Luteimonas marina]|nr:hypothetical protein [Luteimonas marina]
MPIIAIGLTACAIEGRHPRESGDPASLRKAKWMTSHSAVEKRFPLSRG